MPKLTRDDLRALREAKRRETAGRGAEGGAARVVVGMGTCGIAAGAAAAFEAFIDEIGKNHLDGVEVCRTGCMGLCYSEPTVEVIQPGMPTVVYGKVDAEVARRIVRKHLIGRILINDHIYDKPAADIVTARPANG